MTSDVVSFRQLADRVKNNDVVQISDNWKQGRTVYGGLTAGLSLAAITRDFPDLPPLRTMQLTFVGPVADQPIFETQLLRQGRNITTVEVKTRNEDQINAVGVFMFGANRPSAIQQTVSGPDISEPEEYEDFIPEQVRPFVPPFTVQFDTKLVSGGRPMTGAEQGYVLAWGRHLDKRAQDDSMDSFLCLGDVLPGAAACLLKKPSPMSSMNWQVNFLEDHVSTDDGWYLIETALNAAQGGYTSQLMRYWNKSGELIAEGMQSFAIFA